MKKWLMSIIFTAATCISLTAQTLSPVLYEFTSIGQVGDPWKQVLGPVGNAGSHAGFLCYNVSGNYIDNEYYSFESDTLDFSLWTEVAINLTCASSLRNGDLFAFYYYDSATSSWSGFDLSGFIGSYQISIPTTAILLSFDLNTNTNGNVNNKYAHVDRLQLSDPGVTLPVTLLYFEGHKLDDSNRLDWATASEAISDYFDVEHSTDAYSWTSIGKVPAAGNSNMTLEYYLYDESPEDVVNYYRLVQYDWNGEYEVFNPIAIDNERKKRVVTKYLNMHGQEIQPEGYRGLVIVVYHDGTSHLEYINNVE
jgi:hypothetical protein